jgi:hypothetical protein
VELPPFRLLFRSPDVYVRHFFFFLWGGGVSIAIFGIPTHRRSLGVLSTFCCCYVYSQNKLRFAHLQSYGAPLRERVGVYNHECIAHVLLQCLNAGCALQVRFFFGSLFVFLGRQVRVMDVGFFPNRPSLARMCAGAMESAVMRAMMSFRADVVRHVSSFRSTERSNWKSRACIRCNG